MIKFVFLCLFICANGQSVNEWKSFFSQKCHSVPAKHLQNRCPSYAWNPPSGCVPWNLKFCGYVSLTKNRFCSSFQCQLWLLTKEGKDFLKKDWKSDVSEVSTTTTLPKLSTVLANSEVYTFSTTTPLPKLNTLLTSSAVSRVSPALHQLEAEMEEEYCFENYQCNTKKYYSDAGCWTYQKSGHSECRLFCSLETCKRVHNPIPGICTVFNCTKKSSASVLLTTTSTSTTARPTSTTQSINQWSTETITKQPKFTLQDEYCDQNYRCTVKRFFSDSGCWRYEKSSNPNCHLYCELEFCKPVHDPIPGICTKFNCTRPIAPISPIIPYTPLLPGTKVSGLDYWILGGVGSFFLAFAIIFLIVAWFKKQSRNRRQLVENDSNASDQGVNIPLLQQREREPTNFVEVFDLVELASNFAEAPTPPGKAAKEFDHSIPDPANLFNETSFNETPKSSSATSPSSETKKIWPEIILIPELEPKFDRLIVENTYQFQAALLVQKCQIHLWASLKLHDSAFTSLANFGKTLIAINADPTSESAHQERNILNERFQMALEKKMIWKKNLDHALCIFDKTLVELAFVDACQHVQLQNPDTVHLGRGFGQNELTFDDRLNLADFMNLYQKNSRAVKTLMDFYAEHFAK